MLADVIEAIRRAREPGALPVIGAAAAARWSGKAQLRAATVKERPRRFIVTTTEAPYRR
jgi:hypothetical protein